MSTGPSGGGFNDLTEDWLTTDTDYIDEILGSGYKRTKRYIKATDGNGHSSKIQLKVHPSETAQIMRWVNYPGAQYRTMQDFIRDAIAHRLHDMHEFHQNGVLDEGARQYLVAAEMDAMKIARAGRVDFLKTTDETVTMLIDDEQYAEAAELLANVWAVIEDWPSRQKRQAVVSIGEMEKRITNGLQR